MGDLGNAQHGVDDAGLDKARGSYQDQSSRKGSPRRATTSRLRGKEEAQDQGSNRAPSMSGCRPRTTKNAQHSRLTRRSLTDKQYQYLLSLPLALHIPSIHSVIVHAGLVPYDLHKSPNDPSQPLIIADKEASKGHEASEFDEADTAKEGGETDWSQYADDDSDAPISHSDGQEGDKPDAHGHGRPATPRPAKGPSTDAHGHGHSSALDVSSWIDDDADAPSLLSRGKSRIPRDRDDQSQSRLNTELAILTHLPQNRAPYTLTDMRSLYTHGKKRGKITKSSKKGQPWAEVWNGQMGRCEGVGRWGWGEESGEGVDVEYARDGDEEGDGGEGEVEGESKKGLRCSPFTVIYGHAGEYICEPHGCGYGWRGVLMMIAGRGLDIRPFSKGIDTGCVVCPGLPHHSSLCLRCPTSNP